MGDRFTREVFEDHLSNRRGKETETDLQRNYAPDVVVLSRYGIFIGHEGVRESTRILHEQLPDARYHYQTALDSGEMAFLKWSADSDQVQVRDGADSFYIRDSRIQVQTIHYAPTPIEDESGV